LRRTLQCGGPGLNRRAYATKVRFSVRKASLSPGTSISVRQTPCARGSARVFPLANRNGTDG